MNYSWVEALGKIGKQLNEKIEKINTNSYTNYFDCVNDTFELNNITDNNISNFNIYGKTDYDTLKSSFEDLNLSIDICGKSDKITYSISLDEPLRGIKLFQDYIDLIGKKIYRRVKKITINGSENLILRSADTNLVSVYLNIPNTNFTSRNSENTIIYTKNIDGLKEVNVYSEDLNINLDATKLSTNDLDGAKEFLKSNNINIFYLLKNYEIIDINIPDIKLYDGYNKITINSNNRVFLSYSALNYNSEKSNRIFKPDFCGCIEYQGQPTDANGSVRYIDDSVLLQDQEGMGIMNLDSTIMVIDIVYNERTKTFYLVKDKNEYINVSKKYIEKGTKINKLKVHTWWYRTDGSTTSQYITNVITDDLFKVLYKNIITTDILYIARGIGTIEDIILFNELDDPVYGILIKNSYVDFILECLNLIKNSGYNVGVSNSGIYNYLNMDERIKQTITKLYINSYFPISINNSSTTKQQAVNAIKDSDDLKLIECECRRLNKKCYITETGCLDEWEYLAFPSGFSLSNTTKSYGEAQYIYIYAIFNSLNIDCIEGVCYWWDLTYPSIMNLTNYYLNGGKVL